MAFEGLSEKITSAFKKLKNRGRLSEADVKSAMREIKLALLEADVNFKVVKQFTKTVTERATGAEILESLSPAQQVIKIVNEELTKLMGGEEPADGYHDGWSAGRRQNDKRRQACRSAQKTAAAQTASRCL